MTINVYCHIISTGPNLADGNVPDQWVAAQINTMNKAYVATGFQVCALLLTRVPINAAPHELPDLQSIQTSAQCCSFHEALMGKACSALLSNQ